MNDARTSSRPAVLMIAYTNYASDPRVIRAAEAAAEGGFDVDFVALRKANDPKEEKVRGVRVLHLNQQRYRGGGVLFYMLAYVQFFVRVFFKATFLHLTRRYAVIHVNNMPDFYVFCALIPKAMGAKVILDIHDPMPDTFASKFRGGEKGFWFKALLVQEKISAGFADAVVTVSDPLKFYITEHHGIPAERIEVVANFPDDRLFTMRQEYTVNGKLGLVFHGTILERYGLPKLMAALAKVRDCKNVSVRFIGDGDFAEGLKKLIVEHKLEHMVHFNNRVFPLREIPELLADSNVGLVPVELKSIVNFALPLKLIEYICIGLPVITVRSTAIGYYFGEEDCLFYNPDDPESLPRLIRQLSEDPSPLQRYRERVLEIRERFLWTNEKGRYVALLRRLSGLPAERLDREPAPAT
jgi:glycosyltransferase involved in cell wall biosynthesis